MARGLRSQSLCLVCESSVASPNRKAQSQYPKVGRRIIFIRGPVSENRAPLIWPQPLQLQKGRRKKLQKNEQKAGNTGQASVGPKRGTWLHLKARRAARKEGRSLVSEGFGCDGLDK